MLRQAAKLIFQRPEFPFGSGLGQAEKSQNSPAEKVLKTQKNPAEIRRFQPDLVGVSGFEPEASWSRRLVGYFSRTFQVISAPFRSENFTAASFPARIIPPDFSAFGSRFGSGENHPTSSRANALFQHVLIKRQEIRIPPELCQRHNVDRNRDVVVKAECACYSRNRTTLRRDLFLRQICGQENVNIRLRGKIAAGIGSVQNCIVDAVP